MTAPFRFDDQVALVTGAGRGIGAAVATRLAEGGARVLLADRKSTRLNSSHIQKSRMPSSA